MEPEPAGESLVHLNVGGVSFSTSTHTLRSPRARGSFLAALAAPHALPSRRDAAGRVFIDRDGERFRAVLNFVRCGTVHAVDGGVPRAGGGSTPLSALLEEARFYGLASLEAALLAEMRRIELEESLASMPRKPAPPAEGSPRATEAAGRGDVFQGTAGPRLERGGKDYQFTLDADF